MISIQKDNIQKIKLLIDQSIRKLSLNLGGFNVCTEAGSSYYLLTPIISAIAGAKTTFAIIKNSNYGKKEEIANSLSEIAKMFKVNDKIEIIFGNSLNVVKECDIITNLGFVRPINQQFINYIKKDAVVSLMCESWEARPEDIDIKYCIKKKIAVIGVNEDHADIRIMDYISDLAIMKKDEYFLKKIAVFGSCKFSEKILQHHKWDRYYLTEFENLIENIDDYDGVLLSHHSIENREYFNKLELTRINRRIKFIQISGGLISYTHANKMGFNVYPPKLVKAGYMGWTLIELGPKPLIDLHTAGLRVGEIVKRSGLQNALEHSLCQRVEVDFEI
jgi:hypothetical protein